MSHAWSIMTDCFMIVIIRAKWHEAAVAVVDWQWVNIKSTPNQLWRQSGEWKLSLELPVLVPVLLYFCSGNSISRSLTLSEDMYWGREGYLIHVKLIYGEWVNGATTITFQQNVDTSVEHTVFRALSIKHLVPWRVPCANGFKSNLHFFFHESRTIFHWQRRYCCGSNEDVPSSLRQVKNLPMVFISGKNIYISVDE